MNQISSAFQLRLPQLNHRASILIGEAVNNLHRNRHPFDADLPIDPAKARTLYGKLEKRAEEFGSERIDLILEKFTDDVESGLGQGVIRRVPILTPIPRPPVAGIRLGKRVFEFDTKTTETATFLTTFTAFLDSYHVSYLDLAKALSLTGANVVSGSFSRLREERSVHSLFISIKKDPDAFFSSVERVMGEKSGNEVTIDLKTRENVASTLNALIDARQQRGGRS
jgi:hypothetical protein